MTSEPFDEKKWSDEVAKYSTEPPTGEERIEYEAMMLRSGYLVANAKNERELTMKWSEEVAYAAAAAQKHLGYEAYSKDPYGYISFELVAKLLVSILP